MKSLLTAIQFLTVIPFPKSFVAEEKDLERCVPFFPIVGLFIGIIVAAVDCDYRDCHDGHIGRFAHGWPRRHSRWVFQFPTA